jgi:hypothetical protein
MVAIIGLRPTMTPCQYLLGDIPKEKHVLRVSLPSRLAGFKKQRSPKFHFAPKSKMKKR